MAGARTYLADIFAGCATPRDRMVMMLQCYLDGAGNEPSSPYVTMAGHIAHRYHWDQFEKRSNRLFDTNNVDVFHAMHLEDGVGCFDGWDRTRKIGFISQWAALARLKRVTGLSVTIPRSAYKAAQDEHKVHVNVSPLHQCFISVLKLILNDEGLGALVERNKLAFFVESGEQTTGIEKWYRAQRALPGNDDTLKGLALVDKESCRAIQYADALAFYSRRHALRVDTHGEKKPPPEFEAMLEQHLHLGGVVDGFTRSDVPRWKLKASWTASKP